MGGQNTRPGNAAEAAAQAAAGLLEVTLSGGFNRADTELLEALAAVAVADVQRYIERVRRLYSDFERRENVRRQRWMSPRSKPTETERYLIERTKSSGSATTSTSISVYNRYPERAGAQLRKDPMSFFDRLKAASEVEWRSYIEHPFTNAMADGSLPEPAFRYYLVQDYLFLIEFARAYALSVYKSPSLADMREGAVGLSAILDVEMDLHVKICADWGLSPSELEQAAPAPEMLAYTRYVLDAGMRSDLLALKVALAPCVIGYAEIAIRLAMHPSAGAAGNRYRAWIAEYAGPAYQEVATRARVHLDRLAAHYATPAREAELISIFKEATRLENDFWEMGWRRVRPVGQRP